MELKQIKELMTAMKREGIKKLVVKEQSGFEVQLERNDEVSHVVHAAPAAMPVVHQREAEHHVRFPHRTLNQHEESPREKEGKYVSSPMVGTFYASPSPDDPAFVKVGDKIDENTVLCIIEAMKVMNEVKAGISGTIEEILIENGDPVEFGSKLFRIV